MNKSFEFAFDDIAWCPGCGNFSIRKALIAALDELGLDKTKTVIVSGIGQAAKMPQYLDVNFFNGLHGRGLPPATAIKAVNPDLTVIAEGGDGDMYGEGGNHFLHAARRNPDITLLVHDNMIYGLTKGQAAPTTREGMLTPVQVNGVKANPLNPLAMAISMDVPFVARAFSGNEKQTKELIKEALEFKGFALIDIFQPCVTFNKTNTFKWFKDNTYYLDKKYDPEDRVAAFAKSLEEEPFPLGVLYRNTGRATFEEGLEVYKKNASPLTERKADLKKLQSIIDSRR